MTHPDDIHWKPSMGGAYAEYESDYDEAVRDMIVEGAKWLARNDEATPEFSEAEGAVGIVKAENEDGEELMSVVSATPEESPTGAMVHTAIQHLAYINQNGWDEYVAVKEDEE